MLVLSRKVEESIVIADDIVVTVIGISGDKVILGFEAPKKVTIHRQELYDTIQREDRADEGRSELEEKTSGGGSSAVPNTPNYNSQRSQSTSSLNYDPSIGPKEELGGYID